MDKREVYNEYMRYGEILQCDDYNFSEDGVFITMKVAKLDGIARLFIMRNGEVVHMEIVNK